MTQLVELAQVMVQGSFSETYRTCGTPGCRCHRGEKHGPHLYLTFKGDSGKTTSRYVPQGMEEPFREAVAAWRRFQEVAKELAAANRQQLTARRPRRGESADAG